MQPPQNRFQKKNKQLYNIIDTIDLLTEEDSFAHRYNHWLKCTREMNKQNMKLLKDQTSSNQPKLNQEQKKSQVGI